MVYPQKKNPNGMPERTAAILAIHANPGIVGREQQDAFLQSLFRSPYTDEGAEQSLLTAVKELRTQLQNDFRHNRMSRDFTFDDFFFKGPKAVLKQSWLDYKGLELDDNARENSDGRSSDSSKDDKSTVPDSDEERSWTDLRATDGPDESMPYATDLLTDRANVCDGSVARQPMQSPSRLAAAAAAAAAAPECLTRQADVPHGRVLRATTRLMRQTHESDTIRAADHLTRQIDDYDLVLSDTSPDMVDLESTDADASGISEPRSGSNLVHTQGDDFFHLRNLPLRACEIVPIADGAWLDRQMDDIKENLQNAVLSYFQSHECDVNAASHVLLRCNDDLGSLYAEMFGEQRWRLRMRNEDVVPIRQHYFVMGLFGCAIVQTVFARALPWDIVAATKGFLGTNLQHFQDVMNAKKVDLDEVLKLVASKQILDPTFQDGVVIKHAMRLSEFAILTVRPHLGILTAGSCRPGPPIGYDDWHLYLDQAFKTAIIIKQMVEHCPEGSCCFFGARPGDLDFNLHKPFWPLRNEARPTILHPLLPGVSKINRNGKEIVLRKALVIPG